MPAKIDAKDYIDELLFNIQRRDSIKAKVLLRHINDVEAGARRRLVFELSRCDDSYSLPLLASLVVENQEISKDMPVVRQVLLTKFVANPSALPPYLRTGFPHARVFFAGIAAETHCEEAVPALLEALDGEGSEAEVEEAFINALGEMCVPEAANLIAERLRNPSSPLAKAAARALGRIASPTAMQRLSECVGHDAELDAIALDVFAEVQDETSLRKLNEAMLSHSAAIRNSAKSKLVKVGFKVVPMLIENLSREDDPDLLIHSLNVLALIPDRSAIPPIRKLINSEPKDPNVRFAAYETLGTLPLEKGAYVLAAGLADPVENVCVAAAKAIDRNYGEALSIGIRNLIGAGGETFKRIVMAVVDAEADNIFMDLVDDDAFRKLAMVYLRNKAHRDVAGHFRKLFERVERKDLLVAVGAETKPEPLKPGRGCVVVDDSKMILSVYRATLHGLGWNVELFEEPKKALERLKTGSAPDILITDLNMPEMTGIELAAAVRAALPNAAFPILMVTTQHEPQDSEAAMKAGVDLVTHKPFTAESLGSAMDSVLATRKA